MITPYWIQHDRIYIVPVVHYRMEMAAAVAAAVRDLCPDGIAVELPESWSLALLHAASRLPDLSLVVGGEGERARYYPCEPCDPAFEGLRCAQERDIPGYCIDLFIDDYPTHRERVPDTYSLSRIGLQEYYTLYRQTLQKATQTKLAVDVRRELFMARRLKALSYSHDRLLVVMGMYHVHDVLRYLDHNTFPDTPEPKAETAVVQAPTEEAARELMGECGWLTEKYEEARTQFFCHEHTTFPPDRQQALLSLYQEGGKEYSEELGHPFPRYHIRNLMRFARNYSFVTDRLQPDLFQMVSVAKGCVDDSYAYFVWKKATNYSYRKNIDNLPEVSPSVEEVWGGSKKLWFRPKSPSRKQHYAQRLRKERATYQFAPRAPFTICSYPPEDVIVEHFGRFLQKKGTQILMEEGSRTVPFSTSLEDGIDTRETIRHFAEKQLYVKIQGKPRGGVGSVVVIFDEDRFETTSREKYPWCTTWLGEHDQESDMALYATEMGRQVIGPGICRCEYGGFMMSYPPRRMWDVWMDEDYRFCRSKSEVLLMAAIDYAIKPVVVYVAATPPRNFFKSLAGRFGKKVVYLPIGQLSPVTLQKIRLFHVLDGHDRRDIAGEYI